MSTGRIKQLAFSEGVTVANPSEITIDEAAGLASYASTAAYVSAEGTATAGDAFYDTTANVIKYYDGGTWRTVTNTTTALSNPMSTVGDTVYGGASGAPTRLPGNTTTTVRFLRSVGDGANAAAPGWAVVDKADVSGLTDSSSPTFAAVTISGSSGSVYSGTYTPTITGDGNISATTAFVCNYMRIQNQVMVTGKFNADPVSSGVATAIGVSLPVASNFTNNRDCSGTGCTDTYNPTNVTADTTNDRATITFVPSGTANSEHRFSFMYLVQ